MIAYLRGRVLELSPGRVLLEVGGVGYELQLPLSAFSQLQGQGETSLYVHTYLRQDQLVLFGFTSAVEREVFRLLLGVAGVGPRMALALLSAIPPAELVTAVEAGHWQVLAQAPGVGRRTAERVVVELKGKLTKVVEPVAESLREDALSALVNLGYGSKQAGEVLSVLFRERGDWQLPDLLREALRRLVRVSTLS